MEVLILPGHIAKDLHGNVYEIEGLEIVKPKNVRIIYELDTEIYKGAAVPGTKSNGYILPGSRKIMLL